MDCPPKNVPVIETWFVPVFEQKIQGLFKDFQGHISHISRTLFNSKRALILMSFFSSSTT